MEIFKKMFAEKILSFHEGTNRSLEILTKMPLVGEYISNQVIHKRNSKMRMTIGVMAVFVRMIVQFIKKYLCCLRFAEDLPTIHCLQWVTGII